MEDDCDSTQPECFETGMHCLVQDLLEMQDTTLWGMKAHQHATNPQRWPSIPRQQGEQMGGWVNKMVVSMKVCFERDFSTKVTVKKRHSGTNTVMCIL